ncbi:MAG: helix-turn-helix transcriptional regulator [Victivallales bacterium]|nr:helix-turn-helix transcriptional regulator [Victivallales bacterium]
MAVSARNLYDSAKFAERLNFSFGIMDGETAGQVFPVIRSVHCYRLNHSSVGAMTSPSCWAVEYHSKLAGEIILPNGERYERRKESVHLYAPDCEYREDTTRAEFPIRETYITFQFGESADLRSLTADAGFAVFLHAGAAGRVMLDVVEACRKRGASARLAAQSGLVGILDILTQSRSHSKNTYVIDLFQRSSNDFSEEVEEYLRRRLSERVSTAEIARYMKVSESTLSHRFKEERGIAPISRLIELRVDFAKALLIKGELLKIIADMTGFSDEFHLSKTFKKVVGESPREFRKEFSYGG